MTKINFESPVLDELHTAVAGARSFYGGLSQMAGQGKLGLVAKELAKLADDVAKSGYVPPAMREKFDYHDKLSKSVSDREVAKYHREKAAEIRKQMGE